jgi:hypothetical protein
MIHKARVGELILGIIGLGVCIVAMSTAGVSLLWLFMATVSLMCIFGPLSGLVRKRK